MDVFQKNDIGTEIILIIRDQSDQVVNVSTATTQRIEYIKPDKSTGVWTTTFVTDGSDGKIRFLTIPGSLDQSGDWMIQGYIVLASGTTFHTGYGSFTVRDNA